MRAKDGLEQQDGLVLIAHEVLQKRERRSIQSERLFCEQIVPVMVSLSLVSSNELAQLLSLQGLQRVKLLPRRKHIKRGQEGVHLRNGLAKEGQQELLTSLPVRTQCCQQQVSIWPVKPELDLKDLAELHEK